MVYWPKCGLAGVKQRRRNLEFNRVVQPSFFSLCLGIFLVGSNVVLPSSDSDEYLALYHLRKEHFFEIFTQPLPQQLLQIRTT